MNRLKKSVSHGLLAILGLCISAFGSTAFAQSAIPSVIPSADTNIGGSGGYCIGLADRIRTGNIHLAQIPCFLKYFTQTLIGIAGTISVIMVMYGGFMYIIKGDEDKTKFKDTIVYALVGLAISLLAWIIIDLVVRFATE